jgi:hypothetical protein
MTTTLASIATSRILAEGSRKLLTHLRNAETDTMPSLDVPHLQVTTGPQASLVPGTLCLVGLESKGQRLADSSLYSRWDLLDYRATADREKNLGPIE